MAWLEPEAVKQLSTIRQESDWTAVDYYHVELDQHAILLAEGLPAESYIDTGDSGFFDNSSAPLVLHPDLTDESDYPTREAGSCVPFVWDEPNVRPVWQRLADRATAIGQPVPQPATTTEANLRVRGRKGERNHGKPLYARTIANRGASMAGGSSQAWRSREAHRAARRRRTA